MTTTICQNELQASISSRPCQNPPQGITSRSRLSGSVLQDAERREPVTLCLESPTVALNGGISEGDYQQIAAWVQERDAADASERKRRASRLGYIAIRAQNQGLEVYEKGIRMRSESLGKGQFHGGKRGKIVTLSLKAAANCRDYLLTHDRKGCRPLKASLTMPGDHDPDLWQKMVKRLRMAALRAGVSYVYRIELQKRKVPHLHIVAWIPEGTTHHRLFSETWIDMLPPDRRKMKGVAKHCAQYEYFPQGDTGLEWFAYLVSHTCKAKKEQLGWHGKQWGVVGKEWMELQTGKVVELFGVRRARFQRSLRRMLSKPASGVIGGRENWKKMLQSLTPEARKELRRNCRRAGQLPVRLRRLPYYKGWTRMIDPERIKPLLAWATDH